MTSALRQFLRDETAATAIEYAIIAGGLSIVIVAAVQSIGTSLSRPAPRMIVVGAQEVTSASVSVSETTYFWAPLIQSANLPERSGHAAAEKNFEGGAAKLRASGA